MNCAMKDAMGGAYTLPVIEGCPELRGYASLMLSLSLHFYQVRLAYYFV